MKTVSVEIKCVVCLDPAVGSLLCRKCQRSLDRERRSDDGTIYATIRWAAMRARRASSGNADKLRRVADAARAVLPTMARGEDDGEISCPLDPEAAVLADNLRKAVRELDGDPWPPAREEEHKPRGRICSGMYERGDMPKSKVRKCVFET